MSVETAAETRGSRDVAEWRDDGDKKIDMR